MKLSFHFPTPAKERRLFGLCAAWMLLVFFYYFSLKSFLDFSFLNPILGDLKSFNPGRFIANGADFLKILFCALAIAFTLWQWGRKLRLWLGLKLENPALTFCVETALAILFFNTLWRSLGLNGLWFEPFLFLLALVSLLVALWDFRGMILAHEKLPRMAFPSSWPGLVAGMGVLILVLCMAQCLVPQVYYDALVYHLSTLQFWMDRHGIADFPTNLYSNYPFGAEFFFLNGFFLGGTEAAKMLNAFAAVLLAIAAGGWVAKENGPAYGWLAWGMVPALPLVAACVWANQNDVLLAFFLVLLFNSLVRGKTEKNPIRWALMGGLWAGAAWSVKYTAVFGIGAGLFALFLIPGARLNRAGKRSWILLFLVMAVLASPWAIKNWTYTGNVFYPYLSDWMGGKALPPDRLQTLMSDHMAAFSGSNSIGQLLKRVITRDLDKTVAPLFFSFLPFLFLAGKRRPMTLYLLLTAAFMLVSGFLVSHQPRLMVPAFMVCFLAMAMVLVELQKTKWALPLFSCALVAFSLWSFLSLARLSVQYYESQRVWLGRQTPEQYLASCQQTTSYFDLTRAVEKLPIRDCLLVVGDARGLYYPRRFFTSSAFDEPVLCALARKAKDSGEILKGLRRMGVDELVLSGTESRRLASIGQGYDLTTQQWDLLEDFIQKYTDLVYLRGLNAIYRLRLTPWAEATSRPVPRSHSEGGSPAVGVPGKIKMVPAPVEGKRHIPNHLLLLRKDS
jgi:hypothetical protein